MRRTQLALAIMLLLSTYGLLLAGCGYSTRSGLAPHLRTVYVKPFGNRIDLTRVSTNLQRFPLYRHGMEVDLTNSVLERFQFTGLLRPATQAQADARVEGEIVEFRRDALRSDASSNVEEWRLSVVANVRFYDQTNNTILWEDPRLIGDTTYFALGSNTELESAALARAMTDLARRVVERTVESW